MLLKIATNLQKPVYLNYNCTVCKNFIQLYVIIKMAKMTIFKVRNFSYLHVFLVRIGGF